jgi:hypothetical protein
VLVNGNAGDNHAENPSKKSASSVGAAYSDDVAPERSLGTLGFMDYKDFAPTALADLSHAHLPSISANPFHSAPDCATGA